MNKIQVTNHFETRIHAPYNDIPDNTPYARQMRLYEGTALEQDIKDFISFLSHVEFYQHVDSINLCTRCNEIGFMFSFTLPAHKDIESYDSQRIYCRGCVAYNTLQRVISREESYGFSRTLVDGDFYEYLMPDDEAREASQLEECFGCNANMIVGVSYEALGNVHYAMPIEATDTQTGDTVWSHMSCTSHCTKCDKRIAHARRRRVPEADFPYYNGGRNWCLDCVHEDIKSRGLDAVICESCGGLTDSADIRHSEIREANMCGQCYRMPVYCSDCDGNYYEEQGHPRCAYQNGSDHVRSYSYKPRPRFYGTGDVFMGIELEVECESDECRYYDDDYDEYQRNEDGCSHTSIPHRYLGGRAYYKEDGSLDNGFEIVTHPHTLEEYQNNVDWGFLRELSREGVRSWDNDNCGLHVHISKSGFERDRDDTINSHAIRFTKFIYDNEEHVCKIAGRRSSYALFGDKGKIVSKVKSGRQTDNRYSAVNVENSNTYELRVFKGSLRKARVLSAIEFSHAVLEHTRHMKVSAKHKPFAWSRFVTFVGNNSDTYPNLFEIINEIFDNSRVVEATQGGM